MKNKHWMTIAIMMAILCGITIICILIIYAPILMVVLSVAFCLLSFYKISSIIAEDIVRKIDGTELLDD